MGKESTKTEIKWGKYNFSEQEQKDNSENLATKIDEKNGIEDDVKTIKSQFKSKLDSISAEINRLVGCVRNKYEFKNVNCTVKYNYEARTKTFSREDTKEEVYTEALREEEYQADAFKE